jgi:hypothetical protein
MMPDLESRYVRNRKFRIDEEDSEDEDLDESSED